MNIDRRQFLRRTAFVAAAVAMQRNAVSGPAQTSPPPGGSAARPFLIDTNVHVGNWPFRLLKYGTTPALVAKLRKHGVQQAWAGTFDAMFTKDMSGANVRLVEECRGHGNDFLVPIGGINPLWPDWEEDLRRCHEIHRMPAIRLHPCYQGYSLDEPAFAQLLEKATARKLRVQIVLKMEDPRVHHPMVNSPTPNVVPLVGLFKQLPSARVQLIGDSFEWMRIPQAKPLLEAQNLAHEISVIEAVGGLGRLIEGKHWTLRGKIPIERIVFGSHAPYAPIESALLKLFESPFTAAQLTMMMEKNARRSLGAS